MATMGNMEWVRDNQISLVFQGPVLNTGIRLKEIIHAARAAMPHAEIILSTWEGTDVSDVCADQVVFSKDPGPVSVEPTTGKANNVIRQAVSTFAGVDAAKREYVAKIRTDFLISADALPIGVYLQKDKRRLFSRPVTVIGEATKSAIISGIPYHPSDFFSFGMKEDMLLLWDYKRPSNVANFGEKISFFEKMKNIGYAGIYSRYAPEQELVLSLLDRTEKSILHRKLENFSSDVKEILYDADQLMIENFRVVSSDQIKLELPSRIKNSIWTNSGLVRYDKTTGVIFGGSKKGLLKWRLMNRIGVLFEILIYPLGDFGNMIIRKNSPRLRYLRDAIFSRAPE